MTLQYLLTTLSIDTVKEKIAEILSSVSEYITLAVEKMCEFLTTQNTILIGAILFLAAICLIIGMVFFISRKPKLFFILLVLLTLVIGAAFFASVK